MTGNSLKLRIENRLSELTTLSRQVERYGRAVGLPPKAVMETNLILEEVIINIIHNGFNDSERHWIDIHLDHHGNRLRITIEDDGVAFNPCSAEMPDTQCPLENRKIGGMGILLVRRLADQIRYRRVQGKNKLTVTKHDI
jgi:serine/threonine-protein kinase RsbW